MACGIPPRQESLVPLPAAPLAFPPGAGEVPQRSVISPALFNHFVLDYPISDLEMTSYADHFTLLTFALSIVEAEARAIQLCSSLVRWADEKQLAIAPHNKQLAIAPQNCSPRTPTSPGSTLKCKSATRWPRWTELLKSSVSRWTPTSLSALTLATVSSGHRGLLCNVLKALSGSNWGFLERNSGGHLQGHRAPHPQLYRSHLVHPSVLNPPGQAWSGPDQGSEDATGCLQKAVVWHLRAGRLGSSPWGSTYNSYCALSSSMPAPSNPCTPVS